MKDREPVAVPVVDELGDGCALAHDEALLLPLLRRLVLYDEIPSTAGRADVALFALGPFHHGPFY